MKLIKTTEAVGHVLGHDLTQIIKGEFKGPRFKKGHIVRQEDIEVLLSMGKENLYVFEKDESMMHENEAAEVLASLCVNENMHLSDVSEGKIEVFSDIKGLLKINEAKLYEVNSFEAMMIATIPNRSIVNENTKLAGTRIIPLVIEKEKMEEVAKIKKDQPILEILPFVHKKVSIITTGNEVYYGRIKDTFTPVVIDKLKQFDVEIMNHTLLDDDNVKLTKQINEDLKNGADIVVCTGGMSVDPDDKTPLGIKNASDTIVSYGAPVLPGAMFMLAYKDGKAIMGLPGCVMYARKTIFDIVLPSIMADDKITKADLAKLGMGGLCQNCPVCHYPNCGFGKNW